MESRTYSTLTKSDKASRSLDLSQSDVRFDNLRNDVDRLLFHFLKDHGPITRNELSKKTGIPRSTLYDSLLRLILSGLIVKYSEDRKIRGRPKVYYEIV